jgi:hypothetical protein
MTREKPSTPWDLVRAWYEAGHTRDECKDKFGFSKRAWGEAVRAGLVDPRPPGTQVGASSTRFKVEEGLLEGKSYKTIAEELGIVKGTVAFHARRLGRPVDDRFNRRYDWKVVQEAHDAGLRAMECCRRFGFCHATWTAAVKRGDIKPRSHLIPLEELLVKGRRTSRGHLKARLIKAGLKEDRCERCGINEWWGRPLSSQLHHRNGDGTDNRLFNLEFLCPICHAQTENWGGRNVRRRSKAKLKLVA